MVNEAEYEALQRRVEQLEVQRQERATSEAELVQLRLVADQAWAAAEGTGRAVESAVTQLQDRHDELRREVRFLSSLVRDLRARDRRSWWRRLLDLPPVDT